MTADITVALTGASGFVGGHILEHLLTAGYRVRALVRRPRRFTPNISNSRLTVVKGSLFDDQALADLVKGANVVVHVVGIIMEVPRKGQTFDRIHREATCRLLAAAKSADIKRWVHMSALGTRPNGVSGYHRSKWQAETAVRRSGLDYTIFRPSLIHGPDGQFMQMIRDFWCKLMPPFVPYFATGLSVSDIVRLKMKFLWPLPARRPVEIEPTARAGRLQPVWIEDVARCFTATLSNETSIGETYPMGGADRFTWPQLFLTCRNHFPRAKNKPVLAFPAWYAKLIAGMPLVPFNNDQVIMSQEDSVCDIAKVQSDFGLELASFEPVFAGYASQFE